MDFKCSGCDYTCNRKLTVQTHINKINSCSPGIKTIIEVPVEIMCTFCDKKFAIRTSLTRHLKTCKDKKYKEKEEASATNTEQYKSLVDKVNNLEKIISNTNTNGGVTINNSVNNYYIINNYGQMPKLPDKQINKIITTADDTLYILLNYIYEKHCTVPENMNVYISNIRNDLINKYIDNKWLVVNKAQEISNIISDNETELNDWVNENGTKYPKAAKAYGDYNHIRHENDSIKQIKQEVKLMLYNIKNKAEERIKIQNSL